MAGFAMDDPRRIRQRLTMVRPWWNPGDVETLLAPCEFHEYTTKTYRRLSAGLEDPAAILADSKQVLDRA
jgi:cystathionine beta-lyase/cystathionine gamma-synthase